MGSLIQEVRYGVRMLLRQPGFALVAILTLALGIGANSAIFSVVNAVLLSPLSFKDPDHLVWIWDSNPQIGFPRFVSSAPNFLDWRAHNQSFEDMAATTRFSFNLTGAGDPERIQGALVSPSFFSILGVEAMIGRTFLAEEEKPGNNRVALLSHGLWQRRFGSDPSVLGRNLTLSGNSFTVVGILPADFNFLSEVEIYVPAALDPARMSRGNHFLSVVARLKPGVTLDQAQADMNNITSALEQQYPDSNTGWGVVLSSLHEVYIEEIRPILLVLMGAVGFILLIACVNVANLFMARAATREKEIAIRSALGATRLRLMRQLLTESILLSVTGGALGLLLSVWGVDLLLALSPGNIPRADEIAVDRAVLGFTLAVSVLTGILFGLFPSLQSSKPDLSNSLKESGRSLASGFNRNRLRSILVVSEIALALVLLIGAGLMARSFIRLQNVRLGFNPENLLTMQVSLPPTKYREAQQQSAFYKELVGRVAAMPGIEAAGAVSQLPLTGNSVYEFFIEGREPPAPNLGHNTYMRFCDATYFSTLGIPFLQGRLFDERDTPQAEQVVIINETVARQFWPGEDPVGKRISFRSPQGPWQTIIGVAGDVRHLAIDSEAGLEMFRPISQAPNAGMALVVRSALDLSAVASAVRSETMKLDRDLPVYRVRTMEEVLSDALGPRRFNMFLLVAFAFLAMALAVVGIYGVMSYSVAQRRREIGIRMAMGAQPGDVLRLVVRQAMSLALAGVAIGAGAAYLLTRFVTTLLYEVSPADPATFAGVSALLAGVALVACFIPARRAASVDPMVALRHE